MDEQPESLSASLILSITKADQTEALFSLSDSVIADSVESIEKSDLLSNFPITREIVGLIKLGSVFRERRFASKLFSFLGETSKMSQEDKDRFVYKLDIDSDKAQETGEVLLEIIDKITNREKAVMIGKVVRAFGHEEDLSYELMLHMCEIIHRAYLKDLQHLEAGSGYSESNLESIGVIMPIRHKDIENIAKQAIEAGEYAAIPIKDGMTPTPAREPKMQRSGLTEEGANLQRILSSYI